MPKTSRQCRICGNRLTGRRDKIYCSATCKNEYHVSLRSATAKAVKETDKILHRNRSILLELMGENIRQKKIDRKKLDGKKFNYMTGYTDVDVVWESKPPSSTVYADRSEFGFAQIRTRRVY